MTEGAPWKHILLFSLPLIAGSVLQQLYNTADTVIVGNFTGEKALSAVGTTNSMVFLFLAVAFGFSAGNGVLISQHYGAGDMKSVRRSGISGILFLGILGVFAAATGIVFSKLIFTKLVNVPEEILGETLLYFRIYSLGLVFQFLYNGLAAVLRGIGDSAATLYFLLLASVLNILLDLWFVAGLQWGVSGAAHATNISQGCSVLAAWIYMHRKYTVFRCGLRDLHIRKDVVKETCRIGWPIALQLVFVAFGITLIQRAVNSFGQVMTAAFTVGQRIEMYLHLPCNALMTTLATYTGQNVGAGKMERISPGVRQGVLLSFVLTAVLSGIVFALSWKIPEYFALGKESAGYGRSYLQTVSASVLILSLYVPLFGVFQGTRHAGISSITALCALSLRVGVTYLWKDGPFFGESIIWWNGFFGFGLGCILSFAYYGSGRWQRNAMNRLRSNGRQQEKSIAG